MLNASFSILLLFKSVVLHILDANFVEQLSFIIVVAVVLQQFP